jgi:hypothetical protein
MGGLDPLGRFGQVRVKELLGALLGAVIDKKKNSFGPGGPQFSWTAGPPTATVTGVKAKEGELIAYGGLAAWVGANTHAAATKMLASWKNVRRALRGLRLAEVKLCMSPPFEVRTLYWSFAYCKRYCVFIQEAYIHAHPQHQIVRHFGDFDGFDAGVVCDGFDVGAYEQHPIDIVSIAIGREFVIDR